MNTNFLSVLDGGIKDFIRRGKEPLGIQVSYSMLGLISASLNAQARCLDTKYIRGTEFATYREIPLLVVDEDSNILLRLVSEENELSSFIEE